MCQFLLYSKANWLYSIHISPSFYFLPIYVTIVHCVDFLMPCNMSSFSYLFYTQQCYTSISISQFILPSPLLGIHTFVPYICVSISALQISSSVSFFQIPHISDVIQYLFFYLTSLCICMTLYDRVYPDLSFIFDSYIDLKECFLI